MIERQLGLVSRAQALSSGLTDGAIYWRLARGHWQGVLPGVYATFTGSLSTEQQMVAAALYGGTGSQITGVAALRWHGVRYVPSGNCVDLLVPVPAKRSSRAFVRVARTNRPDPHSRLRPAMEICSVPRSVADAARGGYNLRETRAFMADAVQRRLVTVAMLEHEARSGPRRGSSKLWQVIRELGAGVRSAPEAELRVIAESSSVLPKILWNPKLVAVDGTRLPTPDGWIQQAGPAFEQNSREFHSSPEDWHRTLTRQNELSAYGVLTLQFTPEEVRKHPQKVLRIIERAYLERPTGFTRVWAVG